MIREFLRKWLGIENLDGRLHTVEKQFVTKRNESGEVVQTLADVPLEERNKLKSPTRGMSWAQRKAWLEQTDGGRNVG